jgi:hypothetical protein
MKTYTQFLLELTPYQRIEKASWTKAAKRKTAAPKPTAKTALPWAKRSDIAGWYHPTEKSFVFKWANNNYHVTEMVKHPEAFGLTTADIEAGVKKHNRYAQGSDQIVRSPAEQRSMKALNKRQYAQLLSGRMDRMTEITDLALNKGWAMVNITQNEIAIRANETDTHKVAVREILEADAMQGKAIRIRNERNPSKDLTFVFIESAEKFLHS